MGDMNNHKRFTMKLVAASVMLCNIHATHAATPSRIDEVIVTAQKREQSLHEVGLTITAASGDMLRDRKIESINDLPMLVPGLTVQRAGFNSTSYTLRGIGFFNSDLATPPAVTVYMDEAPLPYPAMTQLSAFDLERVEVLKGPQGTLFGQNATGGAVNYIAAKPTEEFEAAVTLSYGRFNHQSLDGYLSGPINDRLRARLAVKTTHADEWQKSTTRPDDELGSTEEYQTRLTLDYDVTDNFRTMLTASLEIDKSDTMAAQYIGYISQVPGLESPLLDTFPIVKKPRAADWTPISVWQERGEAWTVDKYSPPTSGYEKDNKHLNLIWRNEINLTDELLFTSITNYGEFETDYIQDFDGTPNLNFNIENYGSSIYSFTQEFRISGDTERMNWLIGVNYHHDKSNDTPIQTYIDNSSANAFSPLFGVIAEGGLNYGKHEVDSYGIFGNLDYQITDALSAQLGIRYNTEKRTYNGCGQDIGGGGLAQVLTIAQSFGNDGSPPVQIGINDCYVLDPANNFIPVDNISEELDEDNIPWKAGLTWQMSPETLLYGYVSKGYKAGTVPLVGASTTAQYTPVKQESVLAYEVGIKQALFNRKAQMNFAAFYYDYKDKQLRGRILDNIFGPLEALVSIPDSRVMGVEGQLQMQPIRGLNVDLSFTYVDTEIKKFVGFDGIGQQGDYAGTEFPYSPKWHITSDVFYEFPITDHYVGFIGASLNHQSSTNGGIGEPDILKIDAYTLLDVRAGFETTDGRYRIMAWGKNITDEYYWGNTSMTYDTIVRFVGRPATYGLDFTMRF